MNIRIALPCLAACASTVVVTPPATPAAPVAPVVQPDAALASLRPLLGHWHGSDPDHHSTGDFTLAADLGGKVLVRRSTNDGPQGHHEDLTIFAATPAGLRATYFDNEGHEIHYAVEAAADHVTLTSDDVPGAPRFQLRYDVHGADELAIDFAIAPPGQTAFQHYVGGVVKRVP